MLGFSPSRRRILAVLMTVGLTGPLGAQAAAAKRALTAGDIVYRLRAVSDPQLAPDGDWVAYTVTSADSAKDQHDTDIWMTSWDGAQTVRLTSSPESETSPRWSPDGHWLAFLSGREDGKGAQVWLLDRRGGEAQRLTMIQDGVEAMAWSPDSKRLVLVATIDLDTTQRTDTTRKRPIVIDRYLFKQDVAGYLTTKRRHLLLLAIASKQVDTLTTGPADDSDPRWSPDGSRIAFVRTPPPEPGTGDDSDIHVVASHAGAVPRALTAFPGPDAGPLAWSPDGLWLAFLRTDDPKYSLAYHQTKLAIVRSDASAPARVLTAAFDRPVDSPTFAADGRSVLVLTDDDRARSLARVAVADGRVERLDPNRQVVLDYSAGAFAGTRVSMLISTPDRPAEVFAAEGGVTRQLSHQNDSLFAGLALAPTEDFASRSADGTDVHGLLVRPAGASGTRLPLILFIHGGPNAQSNYGFNPAPQLFAAHGYATLLVNYRGSNGRGLAFQRAIYADWGHKEVEDLLGAVDQAVRSGTADPDRLGIGGWSYGGILTDYTIATTPRFKAAISGAGSALQLSMYGTDEYITQYEMELGPPWRSRDLWIKVSYPFFSADRIKTPTLFMGGSADFNVPIIGGEQMYQALRALGVPTQLVIYPNQYHGLSVPSFLKDRLDRYVAWYDKYLKPAPSSDR